MPRSPQDSLPELLVDDACALPSDPLPTDADCDCVADTGSGPVTSVRGLSAKKAADAGAGSPSDA